MKFVYLLFFVFNFYSRESLFFPLKLAMISQDRKEKERSEAKNSVEEYIYEIRDKLSNEFERFVLPEVDFILKNNFLLIFFI